MPVSASSALNVAGTDTDARDYSTASWTPVAGRTYLAAIAVLDLGRQLSINAATVSGNGITWTPIANGAGGSANEPGMRVWAGTADSSATTGALTFSGVVNSGNTADGAIWGIVELTGVNPTSSNGIVQAVTASTAADSITATLGAFGSSANATGAWVCSYDNASTTGPAITAGSGFSIVSGLNGEQGMGGRGVRLAFQFRANTDTTVDATAAAANDRLLMVAFEIRAAVTNSAGAVLTGTGSASAAAVAVRPAASTVTGTSGIAGAAVRQVPAVAALTASGALAGVADRAAITAAALTGTGDAGGIADRTATAASTVTGTGSIAAAPVRTQLAGAAVAGDGAATGTADRTAITAAALDGNGALTVDAEPVREAAATLAAAGSITSQAQAERLAIATLTAAAGVSATAIREVLDSSALTGIGALIATVVTGARRRLVPPFGSTPSTPSSSSTLTIDDPAVATSNPATRTAPQTLTLGSTPTIGG